jgi:hypothetical protein
MQNERTAAFFTPANLATESFRYLLIAVFLRSRSEALQWALEIAERGQLFAERDLESMHVYVAGFSPEQTEDALQLIHYTRGWKGTHFYAKGRMIIGEMEQAYHLESVIKCFVESRWADDYRAHCHRLIDSPYFPVAPQRVYEHIHPAFRHVTPLSERGLYVFPCAYMLDWFQAQRDHPSTIVHQIQADGVAKLCDVCPRFNPDDFRLRKEK